MTRKNLVIMVLVLPAMLILTACGSGVSAPTVIPVPPTQTPIPFSSTIDIPSRHISLREFTGNNIIEDIPLEFDIPQAYEMVNLFDPQYLSNGSPDGLSIWISKEDIDGYKSGNPLPAESALFYIKISDTVIYDESTDTFSGWPLTDLEIMAREAKGTFITFQQKRQIGEFPILIMEESTLPDDQGRTSHKYLYIETLAPKTIGIIYIPSATNIERDELIWKQFIETLSIKN